jgi:putative hydrolase of the HAD superfamily
MTVRAVLFDLDNTLLLEDEATLAAVRRTSERMRQHPNAKPAAIASAAARVAEELFRSSPVFAYADQMGIWWGEALWGAFAGDAPGLRALRAFVPAFRQAVWTEALATAGVADAALARDLASAFVEARRSDWAMDPAAGPTLDALGTRYRLGLVTNGAPDVQREKLAGAGIRSRFAAVVISAELGIGKPDPRIFEAALHAIGASASDAVMVGDSIDRDILGARGAGLRTIWIDREGDPPDRSALADVRITELAELPAALVAIEDRAATARPA